MSEDIVISISKEEAIVLFEWIARGEESGDFQFCCSAEQRVIWRIEAILEKIVPVFSPDYKRDLALAREAVDAKF